MVVRWRRKKWLSPGGKLEPWVKALEHVDEHQNKDKLLNLLKTNAPMNKTAKLYLADMLERYQLKRLRGGQQTPLYDRSYKEAQFVWLDESYQEYRKAGLSRNEAIEKAARARGLVFDDAKNYLDGKNSSVRRIRKRRALQTARP